MAESQRLREIRARQRADELSRDIEVISSTRTAANEGMNFLVKFLRVIVTPELASKLLQDNGQLLVHAELKGNIISVIL